MATIVLYGLAATILAIAVYSTIKRLSSAAVGRELREMWHALLFWKP